MEVGNNSSILVVGLSKSGKTHFGGQLYGRLKSENSSYRLRETPDDLSLFEDILNNLNQGLQGKHTDSRLHQSITLPIVSPNGHKINLLYPEYGGEQLRVMIEQRKFNASWVEKIQNSDNWLVFIRLDQIENIADVTTKFYKQIEEEESLPSNTKNITEIAIDSPVFYIEMLQALLSMKKIHISSDTKPTLTILLSCWDRLKDLKKLTPSEALYKKAPFLHNFIASAWPKERLTILGLSSLGKDLSSNKPDPGYSVNGPETYGYIILPDGTKQLDLTYILNSVTK